MGTKILRRLLIIAAIAMLVSGPAAPAYAKKLKILQALETKAGEILFLKLPGNPSIGYKYRVNRKHSTGLELVKVDFLGWLMTSKSRNLFFTKRDTMNVAVRALIPGQAQVAFDYYRTISGRTITKTSIVRILIKPQLAAR